MYKRSRDDEKKKRQNIALHNRMSKRHKVSKVQERRYEKNPKLTDEIKRDKDGSGTNDERRMIARA